LKDAELSEDKIRETYLQLVKMMRRLYQKCKLVHADLSEYNILYHKGILYLIDVSQSVEHDHPHSLDFLRKDCTNITGYPPSSYHFKGFGSPISLKTKQ